MAPHPVRAETWRGYLKSKARISLDIGLLPHAEATGLARALPELAGGTFAR